MFDSTVAETQSREDPRFCEARLQLLINTLPVTAYFSPLGVAIAAVAMYFGRSEMGEVPLSHVLGALAVQCLAGAGAFFAWRRHPNVRKGAADQTRRELVVLQILIGLSWSAVAWLFWIEGNPANNAFVVIVMVMALWAIVLTRCAVRTVFLSGAAALAVPLGLRFAISDGAAAHVFLGLFPVWMWYMTFAGMAARRRVDEMLRARFAHEDVGRELVAARDDAVAKRREAESASNSKTAFLANMSHELRTPLNAIIGFSEIIASQALGPDNPRYSEYASDIHASGTHLLTLINEILDVAKIEAGRMEIDPRPLDLRGCLEGAERIMAIKAAEKNLNLNFAIDPATPSITADERAFRQIVLNLLSNAVKFTPPGGSIEVRCNAREQSGLVLAVEDTGPGIPADRLALLFKPFTQIDNRFDHSHGGTGLGLALVQGLAHLHGGHAWIDSIEGQGTTVSVYFPLVSVKPQANLAVA